MKISKSKLKSKLLEILREVESDNVEVIVTDRGKPVAKISKYEIALSTDELFTDLRGRIRYFEDPTAPTTEEWEDLEFKLSPR